MMNTLLFIVRLGFGLEQSCVVLCGCTCDEEESSVTSRGYEAISGVLHVLSSLH